MPLKSTEPTEVAVSELSADELRVSFPSTDGALTLTFAPRGVLVRLPCDAAWVSWADWEHVAKVYGRRTR
jgi:hypothetical protein